MYFGTKKALYSVRFGRKNGSFYSVETKRINISRFCPSLFLNVLACYDSKMVAKK
jgi:hypothetical protein